MPEDAKHHPESLECPFFLDAQGGRLEQAKVRLLRRYARKEPTHFLQVDGFNPSTDLLTDLRDPDGDEIMALRKHELMTGADPVRVLALPGSDPQVVSRILRKIADWIESKPEALDDDYLNVPPEYPNILDIGRISPYVPPDEPLRMPPLHWPPDET